MYISRLSSGNSFLALLQEKKANNPRGTPVFIHPFLVQTRAVKDT